MHAKSCILANQCKLANSESCNAHCPHFIALHGLNAVSGRVATAGVPNDYRLVNASNSPVRQNQAAVYRAVDKYIATFERQFDTEGERVKSLYLFSESPGTGKTTTASALLNEWLIAHYIGSKIRGLQPLQQPAYFLDCNNWQTDYNNFNRPKVPDAIAEPAAKRYYNAMERAKTAPLAIIDDIGVRDCTDNFRADLHSIINRRVTNKMPTIYTSNLPIKYVGKEPKVEAFKPYDLVDVFSEERLADRILDMCLTLSFSGESKRGLR
ncbi:DNA replication protein [Cytobacillus solani]